MERTPQEKNAKPARPARENDREARLKVALKANMARRKAQARARAVADDNEKDGE